MPVYEYKCRSCGEKFEVLRSLKEESEVRCPKCGAADAQKVFSYFSSAPSAGPCSPIPRSFG